MNKLKSSAAILSILFSVNISAQEEVQESSNIQNYTPSKLLEKGKLDIKWFNNLYTQTKEEANGNIRDIPRSNFFNSSVEIFTGVSESKKFNAGIILEFRSNSFDDEIGSVFRFKSAVGDSRVGVSHIAASVKVAPFSALSRFSIQSSFFVPLFKEESNEFGYLANKSFIWQNRFFYDYTFTGNKFQLFSELGTRFFFGENSINDDGSANKNGGYANESLELVPGAFFSYFPTSKFTVLVFAQQQVLIDLGNKFSQNYTALGFGTKYQLTSVLNAEVLYSKFVRGNDSGLGQSFNLGLRAIF